MGWVQTRHEGRIRWEQPARLRASSAGPGEGGLSLEREQQIREAVLSRAVEEGLIPEQDLPSWERHAQADLFGTIEVLNEMEAARRGSTNGAVTAAAPRRDDGEQLIASAVKAGKFTEQRVGYWRERFASNPQQARATIEALEPLPTCLATKGKGGSDESLVGAVSARAALALGYAVQRPHPLGNNLPGRVVLPPPRTRTNVITDRA